MKFLHFIYEVGKSHQFMSFTYKQIEANQEVFLFPHFLSNLADEQQPPLSPPPSQTTRTPWHKHFMEHPCSHQASHGDM